MRALTLGGHCRCWAVTLQGLHALLLETVGQIREHLHCKNHERVGTRNPVDKLPELAQSDWDSDTDDDWRLGWSRLLSFAGEDVVAHRAALVWGEFLSAEFTQILLRWASFAEH